MEPDEHEEVPEISDAASQKACENSNARSVAVDILSAVGLAALCETVEPDEHEEVPEISDSSSASSESDLEAVFCLQEREVTTLPSDYLRSDRMQWLLATRAVASLLRDDVPMPLKPGSVQDIFLDVASGISSPSWHCAFKGCAA